MNSFSRMCSWSLLIGGLLAGPSTQSDAQEKPLSISEKELRAAATQKVEPEYPAVARQIRLTGSVDLEIVVDIGGAVERATAVRGNTLLTGPSIAFH